MTMREGILIDLRNDVEGRHIDANNSNDLYQGYKRVVSELQREGMIEGAVVNVIDNEIQVVSLRCAKLTDSGVAEAIRIMFKEMKEKNWTGIEGLNEKSVGIEAQYQLMKKEEADKKKKEEEKKRAQQNELDNRIREAAARSSTSPSVPRRDREGR